MRGRVGASHGTVSILRKGAAPSGAAPASSITIEPDQPVNGRIRISTRRFWALPSGVALEATGLRELLPAT